MVVEFLGEEFLGFGKAVQPFQKFGALFAVFEAAVEVVADGFGKLGDFAVAGFHRIFWPHPPSPRLWRTGRRREHGDDFKLEI